MKISKFETKEQKLKRRAELLARLFNSDGRGGQYSKGKPKWKS